MRCFAKIAVVLAALNLGCATLQTGMLAGKWVRAGEPTIPITMGWESKTQSHVMGDMVVTLPSGERFLGSFVRITDGVKVDYTLSVYNAWSMANVWPVGGASLGYYGLPGSWGNWGTGFYPDLATFERNFTGKIVAGLSSQDGHAIRCKFRVNNPQVGFISGGTGACQVSIGGHILLHF